MSKQQKKNELSTSAAHRKHLKRTLSKEAYAAYIKKHGQITNK